MYKKGMLVFAAVLLAAAIVGCQCNGNMTNPSPRPLQTARPTATMSPDVSTSPDLSASPGVSGSPNPDTSPNGTDAAVIPDFEEGKEVEADTVPEIVDAIKAEFANGEIQSIKHATQDDRQVYAVEIKTGSTSEIVYVLPDGTLVESSAAGSGTGGTND